MCGCVWVWCESRGIGEQVGSWELRGGRDLGLCLCFCLSWVGLGLGSR